MKKRSPKEVIEARRRPYLETVYIKPRGKEIVDVTESQTIVNATADMKKVEDLFIQDGEKGITYIHNHPSLLPFLAGFFGSPIPSSVDFSTFLRDTRIKTMVIAQNNAYNGKVEGYGIYRKTKKTSNKKPNIFQRFIYETATNLGFSKLALDSYSKKFDLAYKFVPAKGYILNRFKSKFVKSGSNNLETKLSATTAIIGFLASFLFLSANFTGNAISNLSLKTSNIIGAGLFIVGLISAFFYFKKRK